MTGVQTCALPIFGNGGLIKDASGNVGIGVTPSAWGSASRAMQFQSGVSIFSNTTGLGGVGNNVYSNPGTGDYYIANGYATRYYQYNGTHVWNTAANNVSGAGAALTFTQAMTLDASGNLGIGTTTPNDRFDVRFSSGNGSVRFGVISNNNVKIYNTTGDIRLASSDATSDVSLDSQRNVIFKIGRAHV